MTKNGENKGKFERRKFIGHIVRDDPTIDLENTRPVEKRGLKTTILDTKLTLDNIQRLRKKEKNIPLIKKQSNKINKPLHQAISWKKLEREIKIDKRRREKNK